MESFERVGRSICRSPYVWLALTITTMLLMNTGLARVAEPPGDGSTLLALVGLLAGIIGTGMWFALERAARRGDRDSSRGFFVAVRWLIATIPFDFAFATVGAGGEQWVVAFGFVGSVVLLVISARRTRREELDQPSLGAS